MEGFFSKSQVTQHRAKPLLAPRCGSCGLYRRCKSPKMPLDGEGRKRILIVAEAPGADEDTQGKPLVGKTGQHLQRTLDYYGIDMRKDCWLTNSIRCRPENNATPTDKQIAWCRPFLIQTLEEEIDPVVIIPLGGSAVASLIGWLWKEDVGSIHRWVGWQIPDQKTNTWICPSFHPSYCLRALDQLNPVPQMFLETHLKRAVYIKEKPWKEAPDYRKRVRIYFDPSEAARAVRAFVGGQRPIAFDLETDRLKPDHPDSRIVSCSVSDGITTVSYPWHGEVIDATLELVQSPLEKIGYNCFSGDTKFLTREYGIVRLDEMVGREVTVLNHEGRWVAGDVVSLGRQKTVETTFSRRNYQNTVRSTWNHEWICVGREERIKTRDFRKRRYGGEKETGADQVPYLTAPRTVEDVGDYESGVRHGVILGDGVKLKTKKRKSFQVRLCGAKKELLQFFQGFSYCSPPSMGGDLVVSVPSQLHELKECPPDDVSDSYLVGFVRGLLATDGHVSRREGQVSITNNPVVVAWCRKHLPRVGYWFQGVHTAEKYVGRYKGRFENESPSTTTVYLSRESVGVDDLLLKHHRDNYRDVRLGPYKFGGFGETRVEDVYCLVVPDGHSFTLDGGLVTGNCKFESRWFRARYGVEVQNIVWDGMIAAHVLDCRPGITSLKFQSFVRLGQQSYNDHIEPYLSPEVEGGNNKNRIRDIDLQELLVYGGLDAFLEWKVAKHQMKEMEASCRSL